MRGRYLLSLAAVAVLLASAIQNDCAVAQITPIVIDTSSQIWSLMQEFLNSPPETETTISTRLSMQPAVFTKHLHFKKGGALVIQGAPDVKGTYLIMAQTIEVDPDVGDTPQVMVTWSPVQKASPGSEATAPGSPGGRGGDGVNGASSPSLVIYADAVLGTLNIDLSGQNGGDGGQGGNGAAGKQGSSGASARSSAFGCVNGPQEGSRGQPGGDGGPGGNAGTGGRGGDLYFVLPDRIDPSSRLNYTADAGLNGAPGQGGFPGRGGEGGQGGRRAPPWCAGVAPNGASGQIGNVGRPGLVPLASKAGTLTSFDHQTFKHQVSW